MVWLCPLLEQEGDDLCPGAGSFGAESVIAGTGGNPLGGRPSHRLGVPGVRRNICEAAAGVGIQSPADIEDEVIRNVHGVKIPGVGARGVLMSAGKRVFIRQ